MTTLEATTSTSRNSPMERSGGILDSFTVHSGANVSCYMEPGNEQRASNLSR